MFGNEGIHSMHYYDIEMSGLHIGIVTVVPTTHQRVKSP